MTDERYGRTRVAKIKAAYDDLRAAVRSGDMEKAEAALDRYEQWADYAFRPADATFWKETAQVEVRARTELQDCLMGVMASLSAAISLLERGGKSAKKAAPSDKMFDQMMHDYRASLDRARNVLKGQSDDH